MQKKLHIIDEVITKFFEHENNKQDEVKDEDIDEHTGMFVVFLPCVTKPTALNLTIFLFIDIDLTSRMGNQLPAKFYDTNKSLHTPVNAPTNVVSTKKKEEESVDGKNKKAITLELDGQDLAKKETKKLSGIDDNSDNDKRDPNSKEVRIVKKRNLFTCRSTTAWFFRKDLCKISQNSFILSLSSIFQV